MRILTLSLQLPLHAGDIPGFRAAIIELMGAEADPFHGHNNAADATDPYLRAYPLVQYAVRRGRATLIGIGEGADALRQLLLPRLPQALFFAGEPRPILGMNFQERVFEWKFLETPESFGLSGWLALNAENYQEWKTDTDHDERIALLSRALTGHLRAMAERLQVPDYKAIHAAVLRVDNQKRVQWHGTDLVRFDVLAEANIALPFGIGLGRAAAFGFGELLSEPEFERRLSRARQRGTETL
jgi:hypothetical protein